MNLTEILTAIKQIDTAKDQIVAGLEAHIKAHTNILTDAQAEIDGAKSLIAKVKGVVEAEPGKVEAAATKLFTASSKPRSALRWVLIGLALIAVEVAYKHFGF